MTFEHLAPALALIGLVIVIASLLSGVVERSGLPFVVVFLALGAVLGPAGLGLISLQLDSPALRTIATLGLVLVLFTDAIAIDLAHLRRNRRLALAVLGPGTLLPAALIAFAGWALLDLPPFAAAIVGAALASTDPVLLRSLLRRPVLPPISRLALRLESGMNDVVLLPIVMLGMLALGGTAPGGAGHHVVGIFLLGPVLGAFTGYMAITVLDHVRRRFGVRRDYESLYALGVAFTAFALAEGVGGSGFVAAFAAGVTVASLDVELCDCFLDYGEATAEMFLLFTFVAFGASLIWSGLAVVNVATLIFAAIALAVRTVVLLPVLRRAGMDGQSAWLTAWLGPRGLSSLLLILLPVFAGIPGAEQLFSIVCLVVLISIVLHGTAIALFVRQRRTSPQDGGLPPSPEIDRSPAVRAVSTVAAVPAASVPERVAIEELRQLLAAGQAPIIADVRTDRTYGTDGIRAASAVRLPPDDALAEAQRLRLSRDVPLILYCACHDDATSTQVARELRQAGWPNARALIGGWAAWQEAGFPTEPLPTSSKAQPSA